MEQHQSPAEALVISYEDIIERPLEWESIDPEKDNYCKVFTLNGIIQKKEEYNRGKLDTLFYYIKAGQTDAETISNLVSEYSVIHFFVLVEEQPDSEYFAVTEKWYGKTGTFVGKTVRLLDPDRDEICCKDYDANNWIKIGDNQKTLDQENGWIIFYYDENDELISLCNYYRSGFSDSYNAEEARKHFAYVFEQYPYYKTGRLLPPPSIGDPIRTLLKIS